MLPLAVNRFLGWGEEVGSARGSARVLDRKGRAEKQHPADFGGSVGRHLRENHVRVFDRLHRR